MYAHMKNMLHTDPAIFTHTILVPTCPCATIYATKTIHPGQEVFMPYGKAWKWPWQCKGKPQHMARSLSPTATNDVTLACVQRARAQLQRVVAAVAINASELSDRAVHRLGRLWNSLPYTIYAGSRLIKPRFTYSGSSTRPCLQPRVP